MKQLNQDKKEDKNIIQNQPKLLGKKIIRFEIRKKDDYSKIIQPTQIIEKKLNIGRWSYDEQIKFIDSLSKYGTNWKQINKVITPVSYFIFIFFKIYIIKIIFLLSDKKI